MEPSRWVVSDDGIEISQPASSSTAAWPAFRYVLALPRTYLFVMKDAGDKRTFDIPRETLTPPQDIELRAFLADRGLFHPADAGPG
jgi:hypothetical protein